jgi:sugar/nucleoside kinase (ribokinase family)
MSEFDVVGVGLNATDTLLLVSHFPAYAGKAPYHQEIMSPGGQVASAMVACAKLGLRVKYIGAVGDDERGRIQMESLRGTGINLDHVQIRPGCPNQSAYIIVDESSGERTMNACASIRNRSRLSRSRARGCCISTVTIRRPWRMRRGLRVNAASPSRWTWIPFMPASTA